MTDIEAETPVLCGLDEAGRGPLAGPLVAALVAFPVGFLFANTFRDFKLHNSKKLTRNRRDEMMSVITEYALVRETEVISVDEINEYGIGWANRTVFERLIMRVNSLEYIVDGNLKLGNLGRRARRTRSIVRADETVPAVAGASILAKVTRDRIMAELSEQFPLYGWDHNAGYGTRSHIEALHRYGITPHHRTRFVMTALANQPPLPGFTQHTTPSDPL